MASAGRNPLALPMHLAGYFHAPPLHSLTLVLLAIGGKQVEDSEAEDNPEVIAVCTDRTAFRRDCSKSVFCMGACTGVSTEIRRTAL